jgi:hypothetical protein
MADTGLWAFAVSAFLLVVASWNGESAAERREIAVFLFAGQSNMGGADAVVADPAGFQQTDADKATRFTTARLPQVEGSPECLPWGKISGHRVSPTGKLVHGPEVGFARRLYQVGWRNVAIIKVYGNFARDVNRWPWGPRGAFYESWTKFTDARLSELKAQDYRYRVRAFVWHQGIDDAIHGRLAASYQENLVRLIKELRRRYGDERTPFLLARSVNSSIARQMTGSGEGDPMAVVRRAQIAVGASDPYTGWIDVDDLPNVKQHHFTAEGQLVIGTRFAERFIALLKPPLEKE